MTDALYLFANCTDKSKLTAVADAFNANQHIKEFYAIDGHHDFIAKATGSEHELMDSLKSIKGVDKIDYCPINSVLDKNVTALNELCKSFALIELNHDMLPEITERLKNIDQVKVLSQTSGIYDLVIIVADDYFDSIDNIIMNKIRSFDGVLRIKQDRIIELTDL